jgi:hypothetical protein
VLAHDPDAHSVRVMRVVGLAAERDADKHALAVGSFVPAIQAKSSCR